MQERPSADPAGAHAAHPLHPARVQPGRLRLPAREEALYDSISLRRCVGIGPAREAVPDATALLRFRHLLEKHKLGEQLFAAVGRPLKRGQPIGVATDCVIQHLMESKHHPEMGYRAGLA